MYKKLIVASAVGFGLFLSLAGGAEANPLCAKNPSLCLKTPIIIPPVKTLPYPLPLPPAPAPAPAPSPGPIVGINVSLGDGGYGGSYGGGSYSGDGYVSCHMARNIVKHHGYRHVHTDQCGDGDYTFIGTKHGADYVIEVSDAGEIINVDLADSAN
jgi:hypothetical protein